MSMSFDVFPVRRYIPRCDEVKGLSQQLFCEYLEKKKIHWDVNFICRTYDTVTGSCVKQDCMVTREGEYQSFSVDGLGQALVFYHEGTDLDREFWMEELSGNEKARKLQDKIYGSLELGYSWNVKRTMGQPAAISLYYGFLAIAIAVLTDGVIYSDDGAWDYACFPVEAEQFQKEYLNLANVRDQGVRDYAESCLNSLRLSMGDGVD